MRKILCIFFFATIAIASNSQNDSSKTSLVDRYSMDELINLRITTAEKHEQKVEEVTANVEVITKVEIERLGYKDLNEVLQNITGFYHIEDHYWLGSDNYGIRGYFKNGPFSNVAILINGVNQMSDKYSDFPSVKITIPIEAVERIEIIKGPMAVMYGSGAFFGAINIITASSENNKEINQINLSGTSSLGYEVSAQVGNKIEDLQYKLICGLKDMPGFEYPYTDLTSDIAYLEYVGLDENSTTKNHLDYSSLYAAMQVEYKELKIDLSFNESNKGVYDGSPSFNNGNNLNTQATNLMMEYRHSFTSDFEWAVNLSYYNHSHLLNYQLFNKYYYEIDYQNTSSYFLETHVRWEPIEGLKILSGLGRRTVLSIIQLSDFAYYGLNYGDGKSGLPPGEHYSTHNFYGDIEYKAADWFTFSAGFRLEHLHAYEMFSKRGVLSSDSTDNREDNPDNYYFFEETYYPNNNGLSLVPKIALIFKPSEKNFIKLLYGEADKYPSFSENYRQLPGNRPQLLSSSIKTLELNYYTYAINKIVMSYSLFWNKLENIIQLTNIYNVDTGVWDIYSANSGKVNTFGFESQFIFMPIENLNVKLKGIYQRTFDLRAGYESIVPAYSPHLLLYANLIYSMNDDLHIGLNCRFVDRMETYWETETVPQEGSRIATASDAYFLADVNLRKENMFKKGLYLNLSINNLLNQPYRYPTTNSNSWIDKGVPGNPFIATLSVGMKF